MSARVFVLSRDALFARMLYNTACEYYSSVALLKPDSAIPGEREGDIFLVAPDRLQPARIIELKQRKNTRFIVFSKTKPRQQDLPEHTVAAFERPFPTALLRETLLRLGGLGAHERQTDFPPAESGLVRRENTFLYNGIPLPLTPTEYALLARLYDADGQAVSKEELTSCVWNGDSRSNNLNVYISYLRKKLDESFGVRLIKTVRGKGFRLEISNAVKK